MASFDTNIPNIAFPHEVDEVVISAQEATAVKITFNSKVLIDTTLYPIDGKIELKGLANLFIDLMDGKLGQLRIFLDGSSSGPTCQILPCTLYLSHTYTEVSDGLFLTRATFKYTHAEAKELLHVTADTKTISIKGFVRVKSGGEWFVQEFTNSISDTGTIATIDVSPCNLFALDSYELAEYTVEVGGASIKYRMIPSGMADTLHEFGFINSFMQEEYITLMGEAEREQKTERLSAYVGGQYRNFRVEAVPYWTIHSGVLPDGMQGLFDDFIASKKVWRKEDNCAMAVTDAVYRTKDSSNAINEGTVTLRETGRTYRHRLPRPIQTFDHTFDDTFQ